MAWETPCDIGNHTFCVSWEGCDCKCHGPEKDDVIEQINQDSRDLAAAPWFADLTKRIDQNVRDLAAVTATPRLFIEEQPCAICGGRGGKHNGALHDAPLKLREGDQQLPVPNKELDIQSQVIKDIVERREVGIQRYGTALQPNNGRDAVRDLYEELLDGAMYAKQWLIERERLLEQVQKLTDDLAEAEALVHYRRD